MPLSEFLRLAIEKLESSKKQKACAYNISSPRRESNVVDLVWENSPVEHSLSPRNSNEGLGHESIFNRGSTTSLDNGFGFSSIVSNGGSSGQGVVFGDVAVASDSKMESCSNSLNFSHFWRPANLVKPNLPISSPTKEKGRLNSPQTDMEFYVPSAPTGPKESTGDDVDGVEPVVASCSVGSGNSGERVFYEPKHSLKRKSCDIESECHSDDIQTETVQGGTGSKRSRSAQVHNLSERRRRDRINEKMRALQELIPNCNKADKASMLDEAIQYLKNLQHQVQLMSMGSGFCVPPMMFNPGSQHMYPATIPHFSAMGIGMAMSYGNVNGGSPQRPALPLRVHSTVPKAPSTPPIGCHCALRISSHSSAPNASSNMDSEDPTTNKNSQKMPNAGARKSINRASNQLQATNEVGKKSSLVEENK